MSTICVSGNLGFIGSTLADQLIELDYTVIGIDNGSTGFRENLNSNVIFYERSICDDLSDIFNNHKFDYVFHLAAKIDLRYSINHPKENAYTNIDGSLNLIEQSIKHKVKKFIFSSTGGAIYSPTSQLPWTEDLSLVDPTSPYGLSKKVIEDYLKLMKTLHGLDYVALRYANVYGPRQNSSECGVLSIFIDNILKDKELNIFGGDQTRDFCFIQDIISANILSMKDEVSGIYNIGSNTQQNLIEIVNMLQTKMNKEIKTVFKPEILGEIKHTQLSYDKFNKKTGWKPMYSFSEGLDKTIEYFMKKEL